MQSLREGPGSKWKGKAHHPVTRRPEPRGGSSDRQGAFYFGLFLLPDYQYSHPTFVPEPDEVSEAAVEGLLVSIGRDRNVHDPEQLGNVERVGVELVGLEPVLEPCPIGPLLCGLKLALTGRTGHGFDPNPAWGGRL
jgi:hypothetical protein